MPIIRSMTEADLPEARRICRVAFGTFLGAPDLETFWADRDLVANRHGAEHIASFAADEDGTLVGSNFATLWGSVAFFGPLTVRVDRWDSGIGQQLVAAACEQFEKWGAPHTGLFTFPQSTKHVGLYGKFGFHPRFLTAVMIGSAAGRPSVAGAMRYSSLPADGRAEAEAGCREVASAQYDGLDLTGELRNVAARNLGDTLLLRDQGSRLAGFALCHWGPASEAGEGCLFVKFGAVRPGPGAEARFDRLLDGVAALAREAGMPNVLAGVNTAREEAWRQMQRRGFRSELQGVTMHKPNEPGYSRPGLYVLDDWR
jgi:predicted N-acetyltransferase YhbS